MENNNKFTNFGFKKVNWKDKSNLVKGVFDSVASKYDVMNDAMSLGIHRLWKKEFIKLITQTNSQTLLDVGGGTADIGINFIKNGGTKAFILDINYNMLEVGKDKSLNNGYVSSLDFICANAEHLPIKDSSIDCYATAFCFRNVTDLPLALKEAYRVLKHGSKFFCLEFSSVDNLILSKAYDFWSFNVIPKIGNVIANNSDAYEYLVQSIRKFPNQKEYASMIEQAGFQNVGFTNLTGGIATIHYGEKK